MTVLTEKFIISTINDLMYCDSYKDGITFEQLLDELENLFLFENNSSEPIKNYYIKMKELKKIINKLKQDYIILTEFDSNLMYININSDEYLKVKEIKDEILKEQLNKNKPNEFCVFVKNIIYIIKGVFNYNQN